MKIEFQDYELENVLNALKDAHYKEISTNGKWKKQKDSNHFYYSETKKSKQIKFTINSIKRQLNEIKNQTNIDCFVN